MIDIFPFIPWILKPSEIALKLHMIPIKVQSFTLESANANFTYKFNLLGLGYFFLYGSPNVKSSCFRQSKERKQMQLLGVASSI